MFRKTIASFGAAALVATGLTFAAVSSASAAPAKPTRVGVCLKTSTGTWRVLEPSKLPRSQYGKCKTGEKRILIPTVDGVPKQIGPAAVIVYKRATTVETCTKTADVVVTYSCVTAPASTLSPSAP